MRLSFDSPFVSYPAQALFAGGAVSIACLLYHRAVYAIQSDLSHKGLAVVVLSASAGTSAYFLGASPTKSGTLSALVGVSLTIFERLREKGDSSTPNSPPPTSTQRTTPRATTPHPANQPPPSAAKNPLNHTSTNQFSPPDSAPAVSVKQMVSKFNPPKSPPKTTPSVPPKPTLQTSVTIETEEVTVENLHGDVDKGIPPHLPPFDVPTQDQTDTTVQDPEQLALIATLREFRIDDDVVDGQEEGWKETSQWTEEESVIIAQPTNLSGYTSLLTNLQGLGLGDEKVDEEKDAADWTEVESSATAEISSATTPPSPTPFEKICAEVTQTENLFLTNLRIYHAKLDAVAERTYPQVNAWKGLNQLICVCEEFLAAGIPKVYLNLSLMTRYIQALEVMTKNYIQEYCEDAILVVQRGPRHQLLLEKLAEQDSQYLEAFVHLQKLLSEINNTPKIVQLTSLIAALENLLAGEKKKQLFKIVKKNAGNPLFPATYELVDRKGAKDEKEQSIDLLHEILDFLDSLPNTSAEVIIQRPKCIDLLEKSKWWSKFSKKLITGDIDKKTLKVKLQALKDKSKPKKL